MGSVLEDKSMISIIIPVYNAGKYLNKCMNSVLRQSYTDFEVILVDDGSTDGSQEVCDQYAKDDHRVKIIHKKNGGVSSARNMGIDQAIGKYIVFVDSDDYLKEDYLANLIEIACSADSSLRTFVMTDYQSFNNEGLEDRAFPDEFKVSFQKQECSAEYFRNLVFGFLIFPPYCKLYIRDIINELSLKFDTDLKSAEDFDFNCRYIEAMDQIIYVPSVDYYYRVGYKEYRPSNHGVLGKSEIKSVHIMSHGLAQLARRMKILDQIQDDINIWAAKKHYFNRLPMLFADSKKVGYAERKQLYKDLISDDIYREQYKKGIKLLEKSTTKMIGEKTDCFTMWWLFYKLNSLRR